MTKFYFKILLTGKRLLRVSCISTVLILLLQLPALAQPQRFAVASGAWTAAIWASTVTGAAGSAATPTSADAVTVKGGITVSITSGSTANALSVRLNEGVNSTATLSLGASAQLDVSGSVTLGGGGPNNNRVGLLDMTAGGIVLCNSFVGNNGASFTPGTGTLVLRGAGALPSTLGTYNNLVVNANVSLSTLSSGSARSYTVGGTLNLSSGTLSLGINPLSVSNLQRSLGNIDPGTGAVTLNLAAPSRLPSGLFTAPPSSLTINGNVELMEPLQVAGNVTVSSGAIDVASGLLSRSGSSGTLTVASGASLRIGGTSTSLPAGFSYSFASGSTVEYYGDVQTIGGATYGNLLLSGAAKSLAGTTIVNGTLSSVADLSGNGQSLTLNGPWINSGTADMAGSTVRFSGTVAQSVPGIAYGNLAIANTTAVATAMGPVSVSGIFSSSAGSTLDLGIYSLEAATVTHAGTLRTQNTSATPIPSGRTWGGTVTYNAASMQNIVSGAYGNLLVSGGDRTFSSVGDILISGTLTTGSGNMALAGSTLNFNGSGAQTVPALNYHNLVISGARGNTSITIPAGTVGIAAALTLSASFGNGSFAVDNASTFQFNGSSAQVIPAHARLSYQNLSITNNAAPVTAAAAVTVAGTLSVASGSTMDMAAFALSGSLAQISNAGTIRSAAATAFPNNKTFGGTGLVEYYGSGTQNVISGTYNHLLVSGVRSEGNKINFPSAGTVSVKGNIEISATTSGAAGGFTTNGNTINLFGQNQNISVTGMNLFSNQVFEFNNMDVTGGGIKSLLTPVYIAGNLTLTNGVIASTSSNMLTMDISASPSGGSNSSYVEGPVRKLGNSAFRFPVGKAGVYAPIATTSMASVYGEFVAEYFRSSANSISTVISGPLTMVSNCEYWGMKRRSGNAAPKVSLNWSASSPCNGRGYITDPSTVRVARFDGSAWVDAGNGAFAGDSVSGSVQSGNLEAYDFLTLGAMNLLNPLPVNFVWVKAARENGAVRVDWETATESGVDHYEILRSANGREFSAIGRVAVRSNNGAGAVYTGLDAAALSGNAFYRVVAIDLDGHRTYSSIVRINTGEGGGIALYPNPTSSRNLALRSGVMQSGTYELQVYDMSGRMVHRQSLQHPGGVVSRMITLPQSLQAGVYQMRVSGNNVNEHLPFILQ
jgi:hypothetical protein